MLSADAGLGRLATDEIRNRVEEANAVEIVQRLRAELAELEETLRTFDPPRRVDAIRLLVALRKALADLTVEPSAHPDIAIESKCTALLDSVIGQLDDLTFGKVGDLVRPLGGVGGAKFSFEENKVREMALVLVSGFTQRGMELDLAYTEVAKCFSQIGLRHRGRVICPKLVKSWRKNPPKSARD